MQNQQLRTRYLPIWHMSSSQDRGQTGDTCDATLRQPECRHHVLVLGNAYGVMPYQQPIAERLSGHGFEAYWAPLRGQPASFGGAFSIRGAASDVADIVAVIRGRAGPADRLSLIGHCASSLAILEYFRSHPDNRIDGAVLYSPLTNRLRIAHGAARLGQAGVRHDLTQFDLEYAAASAARGLRTPILLVEPKDSLNAKRTCHSDLEDIQRAATSATLVDIETGYDEDASGLATAIDFYMVWLRQPLHQRFNCKELKFTAA